MRARVHRRKAGSWQFQALMVVGVVFEILDALVTLLSLGFLHSNFAFAWVVQSMRWRKGNQ